MPEPPVAGVVARGHAEQRRHDPADRAGRAVHVGLELRPGLDPHRRAVDPHRAHVRAQLVERQPVAPAGVDERADDRVRRAAGGEAALELALPGVERGAAGLGARGPARAVDDLVGGAHVAVQRVRRRPDLGRQAARRPVVRRVVAPVHAPARLVGVVERQVHPCSRHPVRGWKIPCSSAPALRHGQGRRRQDDRRRRARARRRGARAAHDRLRGRRAGPRLARLRPRGRAARAGGRARREPVGDQHRPDRGAAGVARAPARRAGAAADHRLVARSSTSSPPRRAPRS